MSHVSRRRSVRVLQGFPEPRPTTNPYIVMLRKALDDTAGIELQTFSWRRAIFGRYDVFHAHWPEILLSGSKRPIRFVLFALLLLRMKLLGVAVVRTQHNLNRPNGISRIATWLLARFEAQTVHLILLNEATPVPPGKESTLILHGHYKEWFEPYERSQPVPGRFGYFGQVRNYKQLGPLVSTFRELNGEYSLRVGGKPSRDELAADLGRRAEGDDRIMLELHFLSDAELVEIATESQLVTLAYEEMHNSGSALAALSVARPVLVPEAEPNQLLSDEVGDGWVLQYAPPLTARVLEDAIERASRVSGEPDLSRRGWDVCGALHLDAYIAALAGARRGRT